MGPDQSSQPSFLNRTRERLMRAILKHTTPSSQSELAKVIEQASQAEVINEDTEDMIRGVLDITKYRLDDIMIPRAQIIDIDIANTIKEAADIIVKYGHSRYPISNGDKDHIEGILMAKDLISLVFDSQNHNKKLAEYKHLLHQPVMVPESKHVDAMLKEFQQNKFHMAVVIDEYGGVSGLVTIEDIIELIVGEINDEYEKDNDSANNIVKHNDNTYIVNGQTTLDEFQEYFKVNLPNIIDVDTVAGLVIHSVGHLPRKDESTTINEFTFKVINSTQHKVNSLQVIYNKIEE